ncbi:hypothetical protein [Xanthobacter sp. ZOL 2024]
MSDHAAWLFAAIVTPGDGVSGGRNAGGSVRLFAVLVTAAGACPARAAAFPLP